MSYNILLDDERYLDQVCIMAGNDPRYLKGTWYIVKNYEQFTNLIISKGMPDLISFDNDLGEKLEGYDCLKWLIELCLDTSTNLPECIVHSQNSVAVENMVSLIRNYKKHAPIL